MDLGNLIEAIVYYLLIRGMICLDHQDKGPIVSALVCIVKYWIRPIINHDVRLLDNRDSLSYYIVWTFNP